MVQVSWTRLATEDLKGIYDYISRDSIKYTKINIVKLKYSTNILRKYPLIGKPVPEFNNETIRELIEGNYRIIYKVINSQKVYILTIHHSSRVFIEGEF